MSKVKLLNAALMALSALVTALLVYQVPPDPAALWQPFLQALAAFLSALGVGAAVRRVR